MLPQRRDPLEQPRRPDPGRPGAGLHRRRFERPERLKGPLPGTASPAMRYPCRRPRRGPSAGRAIGVSRMSTCDVGHFLQSIAAVCSIASHQEGRIDQYKARQTASLRAADAHGRRRHLRRIRPGNLVFPRTAALGRGIDGCGADRLARIPPARDDPQSSLCFAPAECAPRGSSAIAVHTLCDLSAFAPLASPLRRPHPDRSAG